MTTEQNKAVVWSYFERAINQGDLDWLEVNIAPGFGADKTLKVSKTFRVSDAHKAAELTGPARARAAIAHYRQAFPDIQFTVVDMTAEEDRVAVHVTWQGTHTGTFLGVPGTGRTIHGSGAELAVLSDGQIIAAGWEYHDELSLLRQIGALPKH